MTATFRQKRLQKYVRKYFTKHPEVKLVTVAGSIGKTFTKTAIATVLSEQFRVRLYSGNRLAPELAPLAILGIDYPSEIKGFFAWHKVYAAARKRIKQPTDVDIIVHELNTTGPGTLRILNGYVAPDLTVITSVTENGIDVFGTVDEIAKEQISAAAISERALINRDDIDSRFAEYLTTPTIQTYGSGGAAEYRFEQTGFDLQNGYTGSFISVSSPVAQSAVVAVFDDFSLRQVVAAYTVGEQFGMLPAELKKGVEKIRPTAGNMNTLRGVEGSTILDATNNNSPLAGKIALQALYQTTVPQRIVIFGDMGHLGQRTEHAHRELGQLCDATELAWVVTVGDSANRFVAPEARGRGCQVKECKNAIEAGAFVHSVVEQGAVTLFVGPDEGVYLEEAVKVVLHSTADEQFLVRQSPEWQATKAQVFSRFS